MMTVSLDVISALSRDTDAFHQTRGLPRQRLVRQPRPLACSPHRPSKQLTAPPKEAYLKGSQTKQKDDDD